jgi:RND family efflux transporter MFP subunit
MAISSGLPLCAAEGLRQAQAPSLPRGIESITKPRSDVTLAFVRPGLIAKVAVKEGDRVNKGDVLVQMDDSVERCQLDWMKADAEDDTEIRAAQASMDQKKVDLEKYEKAAKSGVTAVSAMEVEHARLDVTIAQISVELYKFKRQQAQRKYEQAKAQVDQMRIESPIDGRVETLFVKEGEAANTLDKVVRVVQIDPLWTDVPVPLAQARQLRLNQPAWVGLNDSSDKASSMPPVEGKIIFKAEVADAASDTLKVRVEAPNPASRPAGEHVNVSFTPPALGPLGPAPVPQGGSPGTSPEGAKRP